MLFAKDKSELGVLGGHKERLVWPMPHPAGSCWIFAKCNNIKFYCQEEEHNYYYNNIKILIINVKYTIINFGGAP